MSFAFVLGLVLVLVLASGPQALTRTRARAARHPRVSRCNLWRENGRAQPTIVAVVPQGRYARSCARHGNLARVLCLSERARKAQVLSLSAVPSPRRAVQSELRFAVPLTTRCPRPAQKVDPSVRCTVHLDWLPVAGEADAGWQRFVHGMMALACAHCAAQCTAALPLRAWFSRTSSSSFQ